jgi:type I restriction enzyme S subunit
MSKNFPKNWQQKTLEDCMEAIIDYRGKTPEKTSFGIPLITAKIVKDGQINNIQEYIAIKDYDSWMRRGLPEPGDIVMTTEAPLGEIAQLDNRKVALGQRLITLRGNPTILNNNYLKFLMQSSFVQNQLHERATGTTVLGIKQSELRKINLVIPPLSEQKAIAHILSSFDDKIELNRQMNETLEAMARAIFKSWFVDFDPVSAKRSGRQPAGMDTATADLFPDEFEESSLGLIPKGWKIKALPDVIDFLEGPGIRNWQYTNSDEGTKFINIRCIKNRDLILDTANRIHDKEAYGKYQHFLLKPKDIVVSTSGTLGRFAIVREEHLPLMLNTSVIRMRPIYNVCNWEFLLGYIESEIFQQELNARACGSVQKNFGPMHLKQMFIVVPPIEILNSHTLIIGNLIQRSLDNLSEISTLATLRDTLLPKLMSGEIRVKEAEKIMEKLT